MGCDIHMFAELRVRDSATLIDHSGATPERRTIQNDGYAMFDMVFRNPFFNPVAPMSEWNLPITRAPYSRRNYLLFSFLADRRNYWGVRPISEPRGLPPDVSEDVKEEAEKWGTDGHSHSWLTLEELEQADWHQIVEMASDLSPGDYKLFEQVGRPPPYHAAASIGPKQHVRWKIYMREGCEDFFDTIKQLKDLAFSHKASDAEIRIVFWFDN